MCGSSKINPLKIITGGLTLGLTTMADDQARKAEKEAKDEAAKQQAANDKMVAEMNKPAATMVDPLVDEDTKRKRLNALRLGLSSTIKTSPMGVPANNALKTKLGQ